MPGYNQRVANGPTKTNTGVHPRRRRTDGVADDRIRRLLAKLIGMLAGVLAGFIVAHVISFILAADFQRLLSDAETKLNQTNSKLADIEQQFIDARDEYNRMSNEQLGSINRSQTISAPMPGSSDALQQAYHKYSVLRKTRDYLLSDAKFQTNQMLEHRRNLNLLELLSATVVLILTVLGYAAHPLMLRAVDKAGSYFSDLLSGPSPRTSQAVIGFFCGLILATILLLAVFNAFAQDSSILANPLFRFIFGAIVVVVMGMAGSLIGMTYFAPAAPEEDPYLDYRKVMPPHLLDTSVVIDGRIHEVSSAGFIGGPMVVTNSVLRELQSMSDSSDERKRNKGRRGLELLRKMQDDPRVDVRVFDDLGFDSQAHDTDEQLIIVAQAMGGIVVTNDYNLNRVAAIRDVRVTNINALANAVKTNLLPGDLLEVHISAKGKQRGQGVAYLDDGTMVVVEDGESYIGHTKLIKITSVTQTVQGRLIFGRVDAAEEELGGNGH